MRRKTIFLAGLILLPVLIMLTGCDNFFSKSWGKKRDYDSGNININVDKVDNIDAWLDAAVGNPELADAIIDAIYDEIKDKPDTENKAQWQQAGVSLAAEASGLGTSILSHIDILIDLLEEDEEDDGFDPIVKLLEEIQNDFSKNGPKAAENLAELVAPQGGFDDSPGGIPEFSDSYAEISEPSDVVQAMIILTLALLEKQGIDPATLSSESFDIESLNIGIILDANGKFVVQEDPPGEPCAEALALAAYLNLILSDESGKFSDNIITGIFKEIFGNDDTNG